MKENKRILSNPIADGYLAMAIHYVRLLRKHWRQMLHLSIKPMIGDIYWCVANLWWMVVSLIGDWWRDLLK